MSKIAALLSVISTISIVTGQDVHGGWGDSFIPGVRTYRAREQRTPSPLAFPDSPIFFPGADHEDPTRHREAPPDDPLLLGEPDTSSDGVLDLPADFSEIDVRVLNRINGVTNISDLAALFDLELPQSSPLPDLGFDIAGRIGDTVKEEGENFEMANCKPELVTVPLELPAKASTMYFPTCIRIEQCGGCCYGPLLTCRPTVTKIAKVKVLQITTSNAVSNGRGGGGGGRRRTRRQSHQSYRLVEVARHIACECGCRVREEDCNSDLHVYYEGECACKCKNKDEQTKCEQQNTTKYWDNSSCNCFCRKTVDCGSGEIFSQATCSCERLGARHGLIIGEEEIAVPVTTRRRRKPMRVPID